jgi:pyrroloquinoline quinone biosynthesis protein B
VLGIAQDAGFPQAGCGKDCCKQAWADPTLRRRVASLGVIDHATGQRWLFDCTPDFPSQLRMLDERVNLNTDPTQLKTDPNKSQRKTPALDGIFLTHAHIGHYSGLIHLGREVMGASKVPTYTMPRMQKFLINNGPWSQLVKLENIDLKPIQADVEIRLNQRVTVTPFLVPHRDEFSETVGFKIKGPSRTVVFLPDIDKWSRWDRSIEKLIEQVDLAYLDGTFFENGEIPGRDMALIPHPFVAESINRFAALDETERKKVKFIHFNHTNPVLQAGNQSARDIERASMAIAVEGEVVEL